jgi:hypothetical protein
MMIRNSPFPTEELTAIGAAAQNQEFVSLYLPGVQSSPPLDAVEQEIRTYEQVVADAYFDISAPTDSRPFFYQFDRGIPSDLFPLLIVLAIVLALGLIAAMVVQRRHQPTAFWPTLLYFSMLGIGFMMVEITLIQQTRLFIGHPSIAITSVLATLLIGAGLGSGLYRFIMPEYSTQSLMIILLVLIVLFIVWTLLWPIISTSTLAFPIIGRLSVAVISLLPLALIMGIPFAAGLQLVGEHSQNYLALAWSVNGLTTVIGSVLAIVLAILWGYWIVFIASAIAYGLAILAISKMVFAE